MSAVSRIMVFPEGRSAQEVLAVDLDDDRVDYFSTYPGTAKWLSNPERLREDLAKVGKKPEHVPEVVPGLLENLLRSSSITLALPPLLSLLGGSLILIAILIFPGLDFLNVFVRLIIGLAAGAGTAWLIITPSRKKIRRSIAADEERKGIYNERLRESATNLIRLNDKGTNTIRCAINCVNTIHSHLDQLHRQGLSTVEETAAADDAFNEVIQGHMDERTATAHSKRYQTILREVDSETIASDEDLHHVQQLSDDQRRALRDAKDRIGNAMTELKTLMAATAKSARDTTAKLSAAKLRSEEWKAQQPPHSQGDAQGTDATTPPHCSERGGVGGEPDGP